MGARLPATSSDSPFRLVLIILTVRTFTPALVTGGRTSSVAALVWALAATTHKQGEPELWLTCDGGRENPGGVGQSDVLAALLEEQVSAV